MKKLSLILLVLIAISRCQLIESYFHTQYASGVSVSKNARTKVGLGKFLSRNSSLDASDANNFRDMLEYHLMRFGFETASSADFAQPVDKQKPTASKTKKKQDARSVLPAQYDNVAGITATTPANANLPNPFRNRTQIKQLATEEKLEFYLQGAFARTTGGMLLDPEHHTTVFIQIYNHMGAKKGMVIYYFEANTLDNPNRLHSATKQIAYKIKEQIQNAN